MTGRIPEEIIREIRDRADIVEVVTSYLPLKRSGANHQGLCPFHAEKTPSFNVNAPRQIFHCFGCGEGGNVFSFLMRMEGIPFPEAVRRLGDRVGIEVAEQSLSPEEVRRREEADLLCRINETACDYFQGILLKGKEGAPARRYLRKRGMDAETVRAFRLGFAPERGESLGRYLEQKGFDSKQIKKTGLVRERREGSGDYDLFRRRLLFPIADLQGRTVAFGGRVLDDGLPKYLNSPESPVYHKGNILYGLHLARESMRQTGEGMVVEGYFDLLALHRAGFQNVVATCGTALTPDHARLLKRYCDRLLLLFDQDAAGRRATFRAMEVLIGEGLSAAVITLDANEDPDSFLVNRGNEAFRERLEGARPAMEVFMETALASRGEGAEERARGVEEVLEKLKLLRSDIERNLYLKKLATLTGLEQELLQRQLRPSGKTSRSQNVPSAAPPQAPRSVLLETSASGSAIKAQDLLLRMMTDMEIRKKVAAEGVERLFVEEDRKVLAERVLNLGEEEAHSLFDFDKHLSEGQKTILGRILVQNEDLFTEQPERILADCRQAVEKELLKKRIHELDALIGEAERNGDSRQQAAYQIERLETSRRLKKGAFRI